MSGEISGGFPLPPARVASSFYSTVLGAAATSTAVPATNTIYFYMFPIWRRVSIAELFVEVVAGGAGSSCKGAIWANYAPTCRPSGAPLIVDNTGIGTTGSGGKSLSAISGPITIESGWYWGGTKFTGTLPTMIGVPSTSQFTPWVAGQGTRQLSWNAFSMADTYSNNMPTIATNQSFTVVNSSGVPILGYGT